MEKIALLIIYNHRFDRNIPVLEELLKDKWTYIFHIVPFYDGDKENVIPVYENSYYYQGYIAQAYQRIKGEGFDHFVIMGDDLVINPRLSERNILDELECGEQDSYIPEIRDLQTGKWDNISYAASYRLHQKGAEITNILPPVETARQIFESKGFCGTPKIGLKTALKNLLGCHIVDVRSFVNYCFKLIKHPFSKLEFEYPFVGGMSDFFIIDKYAMPQFCQYCGAFAATNLFIEVAVPTALVLSCKNINVEKDCKKIYKGVYLWGKDITDFAEKYDYNYAKLCDEYPEDMLFVHPVKLSKWK